MISFSWRGRGTQAVCSSWYVCQFHQDGRKYWSSLIQECWTQLLLHTSHAHAHWSRDWSFTQPGRGQVRSQVTASINSSHRRKTSDARTVSLGSQEPHQHDQTLTSWNLLLYCDNCELSKVACYEGFSLRKKISGKYQHLCAGSLLTSRHVVTAAHCLHKTSSSDWSLVAGEFRPDQLDSGEQTLQVITS